MSLEAGDTTLYSDDDDDDDEKKKKDDDFSFVSPRERERQEEVKRPRFLRTRSEERGF